MKTTSRLVSVAAAIALAVLAAPTVAEGTQNAGITIRSDLNGKCLDIKGADPGNSAPVIVYSCHGGANQRWYWYGAEIRSDLNGKCLDIKGADPGNSAPVIMYTCHGGANQRWYQQ